MPNFRWSSKQPGSLGAVIPGRRLRMVLFLVIVGGAWLAGGPIGLAWSAAFVPLIAPEIVDLWLWFVDRTRRHAYEGDDRVFRFGYNDVRMVMWHGGPWFAASEVCNALGYDDVREATRHFPAAECATVEGRSGLWLSESGIEKLAQRSRHPRAREFRLWFEREVMHPFRSARAKEQADREAMGENP